MSLEYIAFFQISVKKNSKYEILMALLHKKLKDILNSIKIIEIVLLKWRRVRDQGSMWYMVSIVQPLALIICGSCY